MACPMTRIASPVFELPYELTSKIFIYCLPLHRRVRPCQNRAPLLLAQICSQWRAVALRTPELWSSIYLGQPENPYNGLFYLLYPDADPAPDPTCDLLELWLSRTAGYPLSITLMCRSQPVGLAQKLFAAIAVYSAQWRRIELELTTADFFDFNKIEGPFPSLLSLAIQLTDNQEAFPAVTAIHAAPNLTALNLANELSLLVLAPSLAAMPSSLTALQLLNVDSHGISQLDDFLRLLEFFPHFLHLSTFGMDHGPPITHTPTGSPTTVIPHLKSLLLEGGIDHFAFVDIPALEHLQIDLVWHLRPTSVTTFLSRSAAYLTHLTLRVIGVLREKIVTCLEAVPSLATLELLFSDHYYKPYGDSYQLLQRANLLPQLRTLIITDETLHPGTYTAFLAVLHARSGLTRAGLHIRPSEPDEHVALPDPEILLQCEDLADRGIVIRFTTPTYTWPRGLHEDDAVGDLEWDIFGSNMTRSHFFSPF
ncbi:hypothetical protein DFH09DRAFT_1360132 [Mycena vulgaris]|nr:hypothetical protein DFH09DRAFT_1360132 [Mycena vulgaris]